MSTLIAVVVGLYTYPGCLKQRHWLTWNRDLLLVSCIHQLLIGLNSSPPLQLQLNEMQQLQTASACWFCYDGRATAGPASHYALDYCSWQLCFFVFGQRGESRNGHPRWYLWNRFLALWTSSITSSSEAERVAATRLCFVFSVFRRRQQLCALCSLFLGGDSWGKIYMHTEYDFIVPWILFTILGRIDSKL